jgi:hypothetical protein
MTKGGSWTARGGLNPEQVSWTDSRNVLNQDQDCIVLSSQAFWCLACLVALQN